MTLTEGEIASAVKRVPYIKTEDCYGLRTYAPLTPTGRWMLASGPYYENKMFVEHKGWLWDRWIAEDDIVFLADSVVTVFDCNEKDKA